MTACAICPATAPDGQHACFRCADDLRGWLAELPAQVHLLGEEFTPGQSAARGRIGGTGRAHSPVPVDLRVLTLLGPGHPDAVGAPEDDTDHTVPIHTLLAAWAGHIAYQYPSAHRDQHGTAHVRPCEQAVPRRVLRAYDASRAAGSTRGRPRSSPPGAPGLAYLPYALTLPTVAHLHRQLDALVHRLRSLTHATARTHHYVAPCPDCGAFGLARTDGHWHIRCTACDHTLTPDTYDAYAAAVWEGHDAAKTDPSTLPLDKIAI